jgi:hypothetical protein
VIGVASRKLKRAADSRVSPRARPVVMVAPERLMPGSRASAWLKPDRQRRSAVQPLDLAPARADRSASQSRMAPTTTKPGDRQAGRIAVAVERLVDEVLADEADEAAGMVARTQQPGDRPVRSSPRRPLADARHHAPRSAASPARSRRAARRACPGAGRRRRRASRAARSSQPKIHGASSRCALELTGMNSVSPCRSPISAAWRTSSTAPPNWCGG